MVWSTPPAFASLLREIPVPPKYPYFYLWFSVRNALLFLFAQKRLSRI